MMAKLKLTKLQKQGGGKWVVKTVKQGGGNWVVRAWREKQNQVLHSHENLGENKNTIQD